MIAGVDGVAAAAADGRAERVHQVNVNSTECNGRVPERGVFILVKTV